MANAEEIGSRRLFLLWDASVVIPHYLPKATRNGEVAKRAQIILDAIRHHNLNALCYIPNIVVAEVFAAFDRECYSGWDPQIYKKYGKEGKTLHKKTYNKAREQFRNDIHNGALYYQYDVNRYHILALDLIAPVDKYRKFYRTKQVKSMGASDLLIGAMAVHLSKIHGKDNFLLLTADRRMDAIFSNACPALNANTAEKLGLKSAAKRFGFGKWSPDIYPRVLDLQRVKESKLKEYFGSWPLNVRKTRGEVPKA